MTYKYSINCTGNKDILSRMMGELIKIGYKRVDGRDNILTNLSINNPPRGGSEVKNGEFGSYNNKIDREYEFSLNNSEEYSIALAIAAIRNDDKFYIGELVQCIKQDGSLIVGEYYIITKENYIYAKQQKKCVNVNHKIVGPYYYDEFRKATPEEIIQHFKTNNMECKEIEGKKIIGYKNIKEMPSVPVGERWEQTGETSWWYPSNYKKLHGEHSNQYTINTDTIKNSGWFEPIYEQDKIKIGGYDAVKEGSGTSAVIAFGCQKFDSPELYAYKKLLDSAETKAELTIHGTKITKEILEKLIEML